MKVKLTDLFKYYRFSLEMENILSIKVKPSDIKRIGQIKLITDINNGFNKAAQEKIYFKYRLRTPFNKKILIELTDNKEECNACFNVLGYLEKTLNYCVQTKKALNEFSKLEADPNFTYPTTPFYQYAVFLCMIKENISNKSSFIPLFILNFNSRDVDDEPLSPEIIFEQIKQWMGMEYDRKIEEKSLLTPLLSLNPLVIETYNLANPNFEVANIHQLWNNIHAYLTENNLSITDESKIKIGTYLCIFPPSMSHGLVRIYNHVLKSSPNDLLTNYFTLHPYKANKIHLDKININDIVTTESQLNSYANHIGAFDSTHSLANTQRIALSCYLNSQSTILPINGAPGTGKTALLRCIFGQYVVEASIEAYTKYLANHIIEFKTPIVCSSTNNQALFNISEGIKSGFSEKNNDGILYKRWINHIFNNSRENSDDNEIEENEDQEYNINQNRHNDKIDFSKSLFVPSIKNYKKSYFELNKSDIAEILNNISQNAEYFVACFHEYEPGKISKQNALDVQLISIAGYFYAKIQNNNRIIATSESIPQGFFNELTSFEQYIFSKYVAKQYHISEIQKNLSIVLNDSDSWLNTLENINSLEMELAAINGHISKLIDDMNELVAINFPDHKDQLNIADFLALLSDCPIQKIEAMPLYREKVDNIYQTILTNETLKLKLEAEKQILSKKKASNVLNKILRIIKLGELNKQLNKIGLELSQKLDKVKVSLLVEAKNTALNLVANHIRDLLSQVTQIKTTYDGYLKTRISIENNLRNVKGFCAKLLFLDFEDINKLVQLKPKLTKAEEIKNDAAKYDKSLRTDNFYYALHLLEALFFLDKKSQEISCPNCNKISLYRSKDKPGNYKCRECPAEYSANNPKNPKLSDKDLEAILRAKQCQINDTNYQVECNASGNKVWLNIKPAKALKPTINFNKLLPIFPIINLTCNSLGNIVAATDNKIPENLFDFLLIDEAGTIPPSKMIILYCAKKVMLFGDVKQLKPVFNYNVNTETKLLANYTKSAEEQKYITDYFSCASRDSIVIEPSNTAIHVANNCTHIILPYNTSELDGDIWLKEHFRCKDAIIGIANELTYNNEVIPSAKDGANGYLYFIESKGVKASDNTNKEEAESIIKHIKNKKDEFCLLWGLNDEEYYESIGIITPFTNQEALLIDMLEEEGLKNNPKVGTVHKFQGSERKIIIFSTVYDDCSIPQHLFFNREDTSMINVAVTRAKDVFICFGREKLLNTPGTHSGIMVSRILAHNNPVNKQITLN